MNRTIFVTAVAATVVALIGGLLWAGGAKVATTSGEQLEVVALKVTAPPTLDGEVDQIWSRAKEITIPVSGGANLPSGGSTVRMRALYTADTAYFLITWADPTQSERRAPFQKQADGSWKKLGDPNDKGGDNNLYYEDKLAIIWNMSIK